MGEPKHYEYQEETVVGRAQVPPVPGPAHPAQYKFSAEELRTLKECNQESFYQRSLPLGTLLGIGTFSAVQAGYLKPNPRFGVYPKVTLAVIVGYFIGKLSYQQTCAEKLMALPGSYIGQLLRDRRDGKIGSGAQSRAPTMFGAGPADIYSDAGPGSSLDLDTDRPTFGDDAAYRPDIDEGRSREAQGAVRAPVLSYEELRRRNRGDHAEARQDPYKVDPNSMPAISRGPRPAPPPPADAGPSRPTNKYGDAME